jgi:hypothetical protein
MNQVKLILPVAITCASFVGQKTQQRLGGGQHQQRRRLLPLHNFAIAIIINQLQHVWTRR